MNLVSERQLLEFVGSPLSVSADDIIRPQFDFAPILSTGEVVHSASVVVYLIPTDEDVSTTIKNGSASIIGTKVTQGFYEFTAGNTYRVEVSAVIYTSGGAPAGKTFERYCTIHCQI
jgi:hypothetical protein